MQYDFAGEVSRWGSKWEALILPGIGVFMYVLLSVMARFPSIWNVPRARSPQGQTMVYHYAKTMIICLKFEMIAMFWVMSYFIMQARPLPAFFTVAALAVILGSLAICIAYTYLAARK